MKHHTCNKCDKNYNIYPEHTCTDCQLKRATLPYRTVLEEVLKWYNTGGSVGGCDLVMEDVENILK